MDNINIFLFEVLKGFARAICFLMIIWVLRGYNGIPLIIMGATAFLGWFNISK